MRYLLSLLFLVLSAPLAAEDEREILKIGNGFGPGDGEVELHGSIIQVDDRRGNAATSRIFLEQAGGKLIELPCARPLGQPPAEDETNEVLASCWENIGYEVEVIGSAPVQDPDDQFPRVAAVREIERI